MGDLLGVFQSGMQPVEASYTTVIRRYVEAGFGIGVVPGLPGCWSQGETEQEALANITDAIQAYLAVVAEQVSAADVRAGACACRAQPK